MRLDELVNMYIVHIYIQYHITLVTSSDLDSETFAPFSIHFNDLLAEGSSHVYMILSFGSTEYHGNDSLL